MKNEARALALELIEKASLLAGELVVVGCSSSEICGGIIGQNSNEEVAAEVFEGLYETFAEAGIFMAAQCCEHLNRALVVERAYLEAHPWLSGDEVNAVPRPKAGGSFATAAYKGFKEPVLLEKIQADAGLDIGGTLIGMHLKQVAVPVRLKQKYVGKAYISAAMVRPKFIGGERAIYDAELKQGYLY